jgi:hypothetical protein
MTTTAVRPDVKARCVRFDLCGRCTMPRNDRHHDPRYRMHRTPYDIPGHAFSDPALLVVTVPAVCRCGRQVRPDQAVGEDGNHYDCGELPDPCRHGHCVLDRDHAAADHLDRYGDPFPRAR